MTSNTQKKYADMLRRNGLKSTPQRLSVLEVFSRESKVVSLGDLNKLLGEGFDRITLYRILNAFHEKGLIHKIPGTEGSPEYALCSEDCDEHVHLDNHVHFKCNNCSKVECLDHVEIPEVTLPESYKALQYNYIIEGICAKCQ